MTPSSWLAFGLVLAAPASLYAAAPAFPPYPPDLSKAAIQGWIASQTDLKPDEVVITEGGAVYALPASPDNHDEAGIATRMVREEVVDAALAARLGGRSSSAIVAFDCAHYQSGITSAVIYPGANLSGGAGRPISGGAWLRAATVDLFDLAGAVCTPGRPAAAAPAQPAAPPPPSNPAPEDSSEVPAPQAPPEPPPASVAPRSGSGPFWVQAGAFASPKLAEARWGALRGPLGAEVSYRLEPAPKGALTRLLVGPFPSAAAAADACGHLKDSGVACFIRR